MSKNSTCTFNSNQSFLCQAYYTIFFFFQLNSANDMVTSEMHRLDHNADQSFNVVNQLFEEVSDWFTYTYMLKGSIVSQLLEQAGSKHLTR